jgi:hypothetical protein
MCPACLANLVLMAAGATSVGGAVAAVLNKCVPSNVLRISKPKEKKHEFGKRDEAEDRNS